MNSALKQLSDRIRWPGQFLAELSPNPSLLSPPAQNSLPEAVPELIHWTHCDLFTELNRIPLWNSFQTRAILMAVVTRQFLTKLLPNSNSPFTTLPESLSGSSGLSIAAGRPSVLTPAYPPPKTVYTHEFDPIIPIDFQKQSSQPWVRKTTGQIGTVKLKLVYGWIKIGSAGSANCGDFRIRSNNSKIWVLSWS